MPIEIIIADDHPMLLEGLSAILGKIEGIKILATVADGRSLIDSLQQYDPDLVLLDLNMPQMNGIDTMKMLQERFTELKVIILSSYYQPELLKEIKSLGARGYLPKSSSVPVLQRAIETVAHGGFWFEDEQNTVPEVSPYFIDSFMKKYLLTKREVEIIKMIGNGLSSREISEKLFVSEFTINTHRRNISRKLNIHTPVGLIKFAREQGLI
jgi:DNA-binding NarL/FixJ family response regulator